MNSSKRIKRIGTQHSGVSESDLYKSVYKSIGIKRLLNQTINPEYIKRHTRSTELLYHPFWVIKNLIIAERPPFPPKKIPRMIFIDAVSGYRGLFSHVPPLSDEKVPEGQLVSADINNEEMIEEYVKDVQVKQINRSYLLKKPLHEVKEMTLVYLPIWKVDVKSEKINSLFYINQNTGESEQFLSEQWKTKEKRL
jgi:hypothetical protein